MSSQQAERSSSGKKELQGPRPAPLKICRESHKIRKPPLPAVPAMQYRPPVIIYTHSPKVIHTEAGEFMTLVQRLTGRACKKDNRMLQIQTREPPRSDFPPQSLSTEASCLGSGGDDFRNREISKTSGRDGGGGILPGREETSVDRGSLDDGSGRPGQNAVVGAAGGSLPSPGAPPVFPPWSPNFLVPSPRLLSPNVFQDFPLFTPHSELFHSPRHLMYKPSEPMFTPPQRPPMANAFSSIPSPSPTGFDLFNNFLSEY